LWNELNILTELAVPRPRTMQVRRKGFSGGIFRCIASPITATTVVLLVAVGLVTWQWQATDTARLTAAEHAATASAAIQSGNFSTTIGQQQTIDLADGSRLTLNTDSQIEIDLHVQSRDIRLLKGEALFEVARDAHRAFRVYAGNGLVRAVGTAFTVYLMGPDNVSVTVEKGEVELATVSARDLAQRDNETNVARVAPLVKLKAGQIATFGRDIKSIQSVERAEIVRQLSWRNGMLRFDGEPLSEVVLEVDRYTTQKIVILDPALRDLRIGGYFKVGETDAMFEALEASFGIHVERINESLVHLSTRR
jgi:transmembrane sensor